VVGDPGLAHLERLILRGRIACPQGACHHAGRVPTYDYQCRRCGTVTEVIHSMLEDGPTACERCGGELRRVLHPSGIIFRGSGFYKTDSRSSGGGKGATTPSPAAKSGDGAEPATGGSGAAGEGGGGPGTSGQSSASAGAAAGDGD
jgi:putative FmdB family regulatory protein